MDMNDSLPVAVGMATDKGQTRSHNEDAIAVYKAEEYDRQGGRLFIVADGVGGESFGEIASELAVTQIKDLYYQYRAENPDLPPASLLKSAIAAINEEIYDEAERRLAAGHMATTIVAALLIGKQLIVAWVGDSRAYLVKSATGSIEQITSDHNEVQEQLLQGLITPEEAAIHPRRNVLSRSLGGDFEVEVDVVTGEVEDGDILVLCSDGLTRYLSGDEIGTYSRRIGDPHKASEAMVNKANDSGGKDNISVIVVHIGALQKLSKSEAKTEIEHDFSTSTFASRKGLNLGRRDGKSNTMLVGAVALVAVVICGLVFVLILGGGGSGVTQLPTQTETPTQTPVIPTTVVVTEVPAISDEPTEDAPTVEGPDIPNDQLQQTETATVAQGAVFAEETSIAATNATLTAQVTNETATAQADETGTAIAQFTHAAIVAPGDWRPGTTLYVIEATNLHQSAGGDIAEPLNIGDQVIVRVNTFGGARRSSYRVENELWWYVQNLGSGGVSGWVLGSTLSTTSTTSPDSEINDEENTTNIGELDNTSATTGDAVLPASNATEVATSNEDSASNENTETTAENGLDSLWDNQPPPGRLWEQNQILYIRGTEDTAGAWLRHEPNSAENFGTIVEGATVTIVANGEARIHFYDGSIWWWHVEGGTEYGERQGWIEESLLREQ